MTEFEIIKQYFLPLSKGCKEADFFSDDVAKISLKADEELAISKDLMAEDVHFSVNDGAFNIASKLLKSNLSDMAACGARPLYYLLGFSWHGCKDVNFISNFCIIISMER